MTWITISVCACNESGSVDAFCNEKGLCSCKQNKRGEENISGDKCDSCSEGYSMGGFPTCQVLYSASRLWQASLILNEKLMRIQV